MKIYFIQNFYSKKWLSFLVEITNFFNCLLTWRGKVSSCFLDMNRKTQRIILNNYLLFIYHHLQRIERDAPTDAGVERGD